MRIVNRRRAGFATLAIVTCIILPWLCAPNVFADCFGPPSGLVSWWRAEGNATDAADGNDGTSGNVAFGSGEVGQCFVFDGNGAVVLLGNPANLRLQDFTIEAWIQRASASVATLNGAGGHGHIFGYDNGGYTIFMDNSGFLGLSQTGSGYVSGGSITDTGLHHVAVSKSGSTVVFYVDGTAYPAPAFNPGFVFNTSAAIGGIGNAYSFFGSVDELAVYNRGLSASEVQAIYNAGASGKCPPATLPFITSQPTNQTVNAGQRVTFSVGANGAAPLRYQWRFNQTNITGATSTALVLNPVHSNQAGNYSVAISNSSGSVTSSIAVLTVNPPLPCVTAPSNLVSWWAAEGNALDNADGNDGTLSGNIAFGSGEVGQCFVFDGNGSAVLLGNPANLRLQDFTIEAWIQRASASVATLNGAGGHGHIFGYDNGGYTIFMDNSGFLGLSQTGSGYVSGGSITDTGLHHVAVSKSGSTVVFYVDGTAYPAPAFNPGFVFNTSAAIGGIGNAYSFFGSVDELAVYNRGLSASEVQAIYNAGASGKCPPAPFITSQPTNRTVNVGQSATFTVIANGGLPLSYQWSFNQTNISGATASNLLLTNIQPSQAGNYSVMVSNSSASVTSSIAVLTVNPALPCVTTPSNLVSWWAAEGNASDNVGGNNGTLSGNVTFSSGEVAQCFAFDGNGAAVLLGNPASLRLQNFTIEAWIRRASASVATLNGAGGHGHIFGYDNGGYTIFMDNSGFLGLSQTGSGYVSGGSITDTGLHHVAVSKSGGTVIFYVDGTAYPAPAFNPGFVFNTSASIGGIGNAYSFFGLVDELSIYSRALTAGEIQSIYNAGAGGKCGVAPGVAIQPQGQIAGLGSNVTFTVTAVGNSPLSYQWRFNGTPLTWATNLSLTLSNVQPSNAGNYSVRITNSLGSVTSSIALLKVTVVFAYGNGQPLTNSPISFNGPVTIQLSSVYTNGDIFYTLDGSAPSFASTQYSGPFVVSNNAILRALGYSPDFSQSGEMDPVTLVIVPIYSLTAIPSGGGSVGFNPSGGSYLSNTVVTVTATPASGWTFLQWLGDLAGTNSSTNLTMNANKHVQALFGTTLGTSVAGNGSVALNPPGGLYPYGSVVSLTATPQSGSYFGLWGNAGSGNVNPLYFTVTNANPMVSALFSTLSGSQAALTVIPNGDGKVGVNPRANVYTIGAGVTLTATPDAGQSFLGWSGDASGANNPLSLTMNQSKVITANFTKKATLTATTALEGITTGGFRFTLNGEFNRSYEIDFSSNLVDWTVLTMVSNTYGKIQVVDPAGTTPQARFYRAVLLP